MIRISLIMLFALSSCAYVDYRMLYGAAQKTIYGPDDILISRDFFDSQPYSFIKVGIGRQSISIFVLASITDSGDYIWVSEYGEKIVTRNGKIISIASSQSEFSFNYYNLSVFNDFFRKNRIEYMLELKDPRALITQDAAIIQSSIEYIPIFANENLVQKTDLYIEDVKSQKLKWSYKNFYWLNDKKQTIKSIQTVHPKWPEISIEFFYKYN